MGKKNKDQNQEINTEEEVLTPEENNESAVNTEQEEKIAELEAQIADLKDKYLRQVAEFDNFRKRTIKEKSELILNGGESVMKSILPVLDDMERAAANMEKADDLEALKEGLNLVFKKLTDTLESCGLKKIETENEDFNTDFHEAIAMIPAPTDEQKGKVIDCVQTGYKLNDKVIRHAKVAIGQ